MNLYEAGKRIERLEDDVEQLKTKLNRLIDLLEHERKAILEIFEKYGRKEERPQA